VIVFAGLVLATCAGLFLAQRLKHSPTSVHSFRLSPAAFSAIAGRGQQTARGTLTATRTGLEQLSFQTDTGRKVTVEIVNSADESVATLVRDLPWPRYHRLCLSWNGRRGEGHVEPTRTAPSARAAAGAAVCDLSPVVRLPAGTLAPPGDYRISVSLVGASHPVLSPSTFAVLGPSASAS